MAFSLRDTLPLPDSASGIEWEETACLLCGAANWSPLVEAPDHAPTGAGQWFMAVQCRECGLCFTNPRPTPESMGQFYKERYRPHDLPDPATAALSWWRRLPWPTRWQNWRKRLPIHGEGRLLDFGCGMGTFLVRMRQQGWNAVGVDIADDAVEHVRERLGLPALTGTLPHDELPDASFDVVTMWHVLEHVHQPLDALRAARQVLAPGGKLLVAVPNIDSLAFRWFGQAWHALDLPRHLTHFAPWTLRLMLHRAGFRHIRLHQQRRSGRLRATARLASRWHPHVAPWQRCLQSRAASNLVSWYAHLTRQSDNMVAEAIKT